MRTFCNIITDGMLDYLVAIYEMSQNTERVSTSALARKMDVSPAAVSSMMKRLTESGHVERTGRGGIRLTEQGQLAALQLLRRHRLLEVFLIEVMGFTWDQVKGEAQRLEHAISAEFEKRMEVLCNFPTHCPHGDPVPDPNGNIAREELIRLAEMKPGQSGVLRRVADHDGPMLRYLSQRSLVPGHRLEVLEVEPFDGPSTVRVLADTNGDVTAGVPQVIGRSLTERIYVKSA